MLKNFLTLSVFSAFAVIVIIAFNIYHNFQSSSLTNNTQRRVIEIPSSFDRETLDNLRIRKAVSADINEKTNIISEDSESIILDPNNTTSSASAQLP